MHVEPRAVRGSQLNLVGQRLSKDRLVRKGWEFEKVYSRGKRLHGEGFTLICLPNKREFSRIGISVNRNIRGAVKRNRIKRIIRESFRVERELFPESTDIVFTVRSNFALRNPGEVCRAVEVLAAKFTCSRDQ